MDLPDYLDRDSVIALIAKVRAEERADADAQVSKVVAEGRAIMDKMRRRTRATERTLGRSLSNEEIIHSAATDDGRPL